MVKLNKKGETLFEALCALAILVVVCIGLATLIDNTSRLNKKIRNSSIAYNQAGSSEQTADTHTIYISKEGGSVLASFNAGDNEDYALQWYQDGNLYYYEQK